MLEHWLIELIGHVSGLSDVQLKQIEKSLPATKALVDLLNRARPIIEQAQNLYTEAEPLIEQNLVDHIACVPASDTPNIRQYDELAIIFSSGHLDGEEQSQNVRIEVKKHRMVATRAPGQASQDLIIRLV